MPTTMGKDQGHTLVELLMVMAISSVVLVMISSSFGNLVGRAAKEARSATSEIGGLVGLEMLRADISRAGFALPWSYPSALTFREVSGPPVADLGIDPTLFNETTPPHAVLAATTSGSASPPYYLVLKSALLALDNPSVGRWGFLSYSANNNSAIRRVGDATTDVRPNQDRLITLNRSYDTMGTETRTLLMSTANAFSYQVTSDSHPVPPQWAQPSDFTQSAIAYAISDRELNMPYNRADYYIDFKAPQMPVSCSRGTGVLYKAVAGHNSNYTAANGTTKLLYPLLSCVGDLQVIFALDPAGNGNLTYAPPDSATVSALSAAALRSQLKQVMVYILAHEGGKDVRYSYPAGSIAVGYAGTGRTWNTSMLASQFGPDWLHYRWKVYAITTNMRNMVP